MDMQRLRAIIDALRMKGPEAGITRDPGQVPRQIRGGLFDGVKNAKKQTQYGKYQRVQNAIGESPVDYDEYMKGQ